MRKLFFTLFAIAVSLSVMAQEKTKQREVGLSFSNLDEFGIIYKVGDEKALWRFSTIMLNAGSDNTENLLNSYEDSDDGWGFGIGLGRELRKHITDKLELRYGLELNYHYLKSNNKNIVNENTTYSTKRKEMDYGLDVVIGLNYTLGNDFVFGAELLPGISSSKIKLKTTDSEGDILSNTERTSFNFGLSNSSARLNLAYLF